jgi:SAM-dependent methyltransferase
VIIYDFGAGSTRLPGVISVDVDPGCAPDIVGDVTGRIPEIPDASADEVRCNHVLEHVAHPRQFDVLREICRVLKLRGRFTVKVPHPGSDSAMVPGHVHVLPPHYWRDIQRNPAEWLACDLVIDSIGEPLNARGLELFGDMSFESIAELLPVLRNVCDETVIVGHRGGGQ